jgi:tetratricopeptide (TPR) repeat protein
VLGNVPGESSAVLTALHHEMDDAIALPDGAGHPCRPAVLVLGAYHAIQRGDPGRASSLCDEAEAAEDRLGAAPNPNLWQARGMIAMAQGEFDEQLACAQRAEAICRANGDAVRLATALGVEGFARLNLGDGAGAVAALEEALELVRRVGEPASTAFVLPAAAFVLADTQPHRARVLAEEAVALAERLGAGWDQQVCHPDR